MPKTSLIERHRDDVARQAGERVARFTQGKTFDDVAALARSPARAVVSRAGRAVRGQSREMSA